MVHDEVVARYGPDGTPIGSAPRSRVRAENLRHATTAIVVFNAAGEVYVHRRTMTKDLYPGLRDFCAGGVLLAGESPDEGAAREAYEELGVHGIALTPLGTASYADSVTQFVCFVYRCQFDGEIRWQREEVASGQWVSRRDLLAQVAANPDDFVPDSVQVALHVVADSR